MNKKRIIGVVCVVVCFGVIGLFAWREYDKYMPIKDTVTVELGEKLEGSPKDYIEANSKRLEETKLDFSKVDYAKVGEYEATAKCGKKQAAFAVKVEDTTPPTVTMKSGEEFRVIVGQVLKAVDLVESVEDLAGIKSAAFKESQVPVESDTPEDLLSCIGLKYDEAGSYENEIIVTDNSGNETKQTVKVVVVEDYLAHVTGFQEIATTRGTAVDCMSGITWDEKVTGVTADTSAVDFHTVGEYTVTYTISGDDGVTTVTQTAKVIVTEPVKAAVKSSSSGNKSTSKSNGGSGSSSRRSSGKSGGSKSSGGSGSSGSSGGHKAGETFKGNTDSGGEIDGQGGNTWESGSFDW